MPQNNPEYNEEPMVYTLTDEDGKQWMFELLDEMDYGDDHYYALTPLPQTKEEALSEDQELIVMRAVENPQTGEEQMETLDEDELDLIGDIFLERLGAMEDALYEDEDDEYDGYFDSDE